jgi:gluconokinase
LREVLCFDIGSGGLSAARFDEQLEAREYREFPWQLPLTAATVEDAFDALMAAQQSGTRPAAIAISSFMHSFLVTAEERIPKTPLHTWMDSDSRDGIDVIRRAIGSEFHQRTGCRMHPMFPVFKLATMKLASMDRVISPKSFLVQKLAGKFVDDFGMAAASGLLNVQSADWDVDVLRAAQLSSSSLPQLVEAHAIVGNTAQGVPVVNGSGDGFMANVGSGCDSSNRIAITIGTSAAARQMLPSPKLDDVAGTFCYRGLLGCASSNGGNVLDWARAQFGVSSLLEVTGHDIPIFMPWLNGERSLEWNPESASSVAWANAATHSCRVVPRGDGRRVVQPRAVCRSDREGVRYPCQ